MAKKPFLVVSQDSIDAGVPNTGDQCPIALELVEHYESLGWDIDDVEVGGGEISYSLVKTVTTKYGEQTIAETVSFTPTDRASKFIEDFDEDIALVKPGLRITLPV